ncbi:MAG: hypothetical protein MOB07_25300 [Acidobacteria bacterium]|nr:hypothetical protein [Acidobacteriota bacterium]
MGSYKFVLADVFTEQPLAGNQKVLPVGIYSEAGKPLRVAMTQSEPRFGDKLTDRTELARALGLDSSDLEIDGLEPQAVSTGAMHLLVPVRSLSALERVRVDAQALITLARPLGCQGCYIFCLENHEQGTAKGKQVEVAGRSVIVADGTISL